MDVHCNRYEPRYNDIDLCNTSKKSHIFLVPINSSNITITLHSPVGKMLGYDDINSSNCFMNF